MIGYAVKQSSASYPLLFLMVDSSDHISPKTGLSPTVTISKNGAAFATPAGAVTEISGGWYKVAGNGTDTATLGPLALHATATGADPSDCLFMVVSYDPQSSTNMGLSALPTASAGASGGLPTVDASNGVKVSVGTGSGQINASSGKVPATLASTDVTGNVAADVQTVKTQTVTCSAGVTVNANVGTTQPVNFTGTAGSALVKGDTIDWGGSAVGSMPNSTTPPTTAAIATAVWQDLTSSSDFTTVNSIGKLLVTDIDAAISSRSTYAGADTSGTTTLLSRLTSTRAGLLDHLDADISSRLASGNVTVGGYAAGQDPATLVLDVAISGHETAGTVGAAISAAGGSGDPWATSLPGSYTSGQAGYIIGHNLDAAITSRATAAAVWDLSETGHTTSGTFGAAMNAAGSAGDPWATPLPGAYGSGTAGNILGNNLDATVSTRLATSGYTSPPSTGSIATAVWQDLTTGSDFTTVNSIGKLLVTDIDAKVSTRSTYDGSDTSGTTTLLSRLSSTRATALDNLDATVSSRLATSGYTTPPSAASIASTLLASTLSGVRAVDAVGDSSLTVMDALYCAVAAAAGDESVAGTTYTVKTPAGTTIRTFTLDDGTDPTSRT